MNSCEAEKDHHNQISEDAKRDTPKTNKAKRLAAKRGLGHCHKDTTNSANSQTTEPLAHRLFAKSPPASRNRGRRKKYIPSRIPIARGSVAHIIRSRFGVLDETLLVDWSLEDSRTKLADCKDVAPSSGTDGLSGGTVNEACTPDSTRPQETDGLSRGTNEVSESGSIVHATTDQPQTVPGYATNSGKPTEPLRMCFRSTVMPISSPQIPKEKYRVIAVDGIHKGKTGFVVEETFGRNSIMEMDDGKHITVSNVHIRTCSEYSTTKDAEANFSPYSSSLVNVSTSNSSHSEITPEELLGIAFADQKKNQSKLDRLYGVVDL